MEADPSIEFELFLALKLGKTRDQLVAELSSREYLDWQIYFGRKAQREELELAKAGGGHG